jgi:hypothetical protein
MVVLERLREPVWAFGKDKKSLAPLGNQTIIFQLSSLSLDHFSDYSFRACRPVASKETEG